MALDESGDGRGVRQEKSAYAARPEALAHPVPGEGANEDAEAFMEDLEPPQLDADEQAFLTLEDTAPPQQETIENTPTVLDETPTERFSRVGDPLQATKEMVGDQLARFRAAWAVTDKEKMGLLKSIYGEKGVRQTKDGTFQVMRAGEKGFRDFDPDTGAFSLDIIGDVLDVSRDVVEGGVELGARFGGGALGAAKSGAVGAGAGLPAGPLGAAAGGATGGMLGGIAGYAAGGAVGAAAALNVGDFIAQNLIGIERDPSRDRIKETAIAGGIGAGAGMILGAASGMLTRMRIARETRQSSVTTQDVLQTAKEIDQAAESLTRNGIELKQGRLVLSPGQIAGDRMPEAQSLDYALSTPGPVRDFFVKQGELVESGWNKLQQGIVNVTGKPAEDLFRAVKGASKTSREVEGKTIGSFRDMALRASGDLPRMMPRTTQIKTQYDAFKTLSLKELQERFPDASPAVLGKVKTLFSDLDRTMAKHNGELPLSEVDRLYGGFRDTIDNFWGTKSGGDVARDLIDLKNALRDDWAEHIGATLNKFDPEALPAYQASMKKYSDIMVAQGTLKNILKKNDLSAASFANQIFSPAQGKDRVRQLKVLIDDADPTLWPQLVNQQFDLMRDRAMKNGRINWQALDGEMAKLEKSEVLDQMVNPEQKKLVKDFFTVARNVDSSFNFKEEQLKATPGFVSKARHLLILAANQVSAVAKIGAGQNVAQGIIDGIGKDRAFAKWLEGEGLEMVISGLPKQEQGRIRKAIIPILGVGNDVWMARQRRNMAVEGQMNSPPEEGQ